MINIGAETCQELSQRGVSKSGIYPIDPDGQDQNESPIQGNLLRSIVKKIVRREGLAILLLCSLLSNALFIKTYIL